MWQIVLCHGHGTNSQDLPLRCSIWLPCWGVGGGSRSNRARCSELTAAHISCCKAKITIRQNVTAAPLSFCLLLSVSLPSVCLSVCYNCWTHRPFSWTPCRLMKFRWAASFFYSAVRSEATAVLTAALAHWSLSLCLLSPHVSRYLVVSLISHYFGSLKCASSGVLAGGFLLIILTDWDSKKWLRVPLLASPYITYTDYESDFGAAIVARDARKAFNQTEWSYAYVEAHVRFGFWELSITQAKSC